MRFRPELPKGTTPGLVLALLAERAMHGYELAKALEDRSSGVLALGQGTLYPLLHRLEREGLIAGRWETTACGPDRRVYRLTSKGHALLAERRSEWVAFAEVIGRFLGPAPVAEANSTALRARCPVGTADGLSPAILLTA
ncbi:MAG: PadR family transcriptional regulator [Chloroflexota bacterium]|nr:MAG: PadR family transcriptional regulator [Chloroflexota bacterium]